MRIIWVVLPLAMLAAGCQSTQAGQSGSMDDSLARMLAGESAVQGSALDKAIAKAEQHPLGSDKNPVRASSPVGQRAYLERLRCADGQAPEYEREGNVGSGVYGNIVDLYTVNCSGDSSEHAVYMDMYHKGYVEQRPVPGFTITP